jgi:hypothetical protein
MTKSPHVDRRTVLKGAGVALSLPLLECAAHAAPGDRGEPPRRMCCIMFPYGIAVPKDDDQARDWGWFPRGEGADYRLTNPLKPLTELMEDVTVLGGLSHPQCRNMNGHDTGDTFLTATALDPPAYKNAISLDQFAAAHLGDQTRVRSLTLSSDGGVGPRTRATTMSYTAKGQPIPAMAEPKQIFQRLFGQDDASAANRRKMENAGSILDLVLEESRSLRRDLGVPDRRKLDEFETSVRSVEQRVERARRWIDTPLPEVDAGDIALEANPEDGEQYIRAIYDLMFLAFQTDLTRLATYQIGSYGPTLARRFPTAAGLSGDWHGLAHGAGKAGGAEKLGRFDQFLAGQLARFLRRLKETEEADGNMLDRTLVLYGSSNSRTHQNRNYPLLLAGGRRLGLKHNQYLKFDEKTPMSNLFVSMLGALGVNAPNFADSTGPLTGI